MLGAGHVHRALRRAQGHVHGRPPLTHASVDVDGGRRHRRPGSTRIRRAVPACPAGFPPEAALGRDVAGGAAPLGAEHVDRTDRPFVTLDPAGVDRPRPGVRASSGRATTSCCTTPSPTSAGSSTTATRSTPRRGSAASRCTCPTSGPGSTRRRCRRARPACCPTDRAGRRVHRARRRRRHVAPRRRRAGDRAQPGQARLRHASARRDLPPELRRAVAAASRPPRTRRGAPRVEFPEQEVDRDGDGALRRCASGRGCRAEDAQRGAVAGDQPRRRRRAARGRDRPVPGDGRADERRGRAGCATPPARSGSTGRRRTSLADFAALAADATTRERRRSCSPSGAPAAARRYEPYRDGVRPWHAAMAATYAHATAPLRRLADRYVIEAALAIANGRPVPDDVAAAFDALPEAMARGEQRANARRARGDRPRRGGRAAGPRGRGVRRRRRRRGPSRRRSSSCATRPCWPGSAAHRVDPGDDVRVRLDRADPATRTIEFTRGS